MGQVERDFKLEFPAEFDWVRECSRCSLKGALATLRETVSSDLNAFNRLNPDKKFQLEAKEDGDKFIIRRPEHMRMVVFEIDPSGQRQIDIRNGPNVAFSAIPEICPDGECWLKVGEQYFRFWQISKRALEALFFGP
jgi:hypothetical protein